MNPIDLHLTDDGRDTILSAAETGPPEKTLYPARKGGLDHHPAPTDGERARIDMERAVLLLRGLPLAAIAGAINAIFATIVGWATISHAVLIGWLGAVLLIALCRLGIWRQVRLKRTSPEALLKFERHYMILMTINGAVWGMLAPIFAVYGEIGHVFLPFILAGMTAAAIVSAGAAWRCVAAFNVPALLPMAAAFAIWGGSGAEFIATAILIYGILTIMLAMQTNAMIDRALILRQRNDGLTRTLKSDREIRDLSVKRYTRLVEADPAVTIIFSPGGKITYASEAVRAVTGWSPEDLVGATTRQFVHADDLPIFQSVGSSTLGTVGDSQKIDHVCFRNAQGDFVPMTGYLINLLYEPGIEGFVFKAMPHSDRGAQQVHAA